MKTIIFILIATVIVSCSATSHKTFHPTKSDTTITIALYMTDKFQPRIDYLYRVTKDTFYFDTINSETAKRIYKRDTLYFEPIWRDSLGHISDSGLAKKKQ